MIIKNQYALPPGSQIFIKYPREVDVDRNTFSVTVSSKVAKPEYNLEWFVSKTIQIFNINEDRIEPGKFITINLIGMINPPTSEKT